MLSSKNIFILLIIASFIAAIAFFSLNQKSSVGNMIQPVPVESPDIGTIQSDSKPPESKETSEVRSPDGKIKLIMETAKSGDNASYSFSVSQADTGTKETIFSRTVLPGVTMDLSPNAWSPDNKYVFIIEKGTNSVNYLVFKANGEYFSEDEQYIEVVSKFVAKNTGYTLSEITGWDSETLLHIYAVKDDGSRAPSFWFEVPSQAIIQLASR